MELVSAFVALVPYRFWLNIPTAYKIDLSIAASLSVVLWKSLSEREVCTTSYVTTAYKSRELRAYLIMR